MEKSEILKLKIQNQIESLFDSIISLEKLEKEKPLFELDNWHKTTLWMIFFNQVLLKSCWNTILKEWLSQKQRTDYILECAKFTKEHYKNLYWYDTIETANK